MDISTKFSQDNIHKVSANYFNLYSPEVKTTSKKVMLSALKISSWFFTLLTLPLIMGGIYLLTDRVKYKPTEPTASDLVTTELAMEILNNNGLAAKLAGQHSGSNMSTIQDKVALSERVVTSSVNDKIEA